MNLVLLFRLSVTKNAIKLGTYSLLILCSLYHYKYIGSKCIGETSIKGFSLPTRQVVSFYIKKFAQSFTYPLCRAACGSLGILCWFPYSLDVMFLLLDWLVNSIWKVGNTPSGTKVKKFKKLNIDNHFATLVCQNKPNQPQYTSTVFKKNYLM